MDQIQRPQTVWTGIQWAVSFLSRAEIDNPRLDSELILAKLLDISRSQLYSRFNDQLDEGIWTEFVMLIEKRGQGFPLQYISGHQEFMSLDFFVNENVLVPRGDTEVLVEKAIQIGCDIAKPLIIDVCTGSGAIALALAHYLPDSKVIAIDISEEALEVAKYNGERLALNQRVQWYHGDLLEPVRKFNQPESVEIIKLDEFADIIVSNPPYIPREEIQKLQREVAEYEPKLALDGGRDGLDFYRKIIPESFGYLKKGGYLLLEIGREQAQGVKDIFLASWSSCEIEIVKDFADNDRVVIGRKK